MIDINEFEQIVDKVNEAIQKEFDNMIPDVIAYDKTIDGRFGRGTICSLSAKRRNIVIDYDALVFMYPYMDRDTVESMLISMARKIGNGMLS